MDLRPVGIFDSGLGGLTAVRELRRLLPAAGLVDFGGPARRPPGGARPGGPAPLPFPSRLIA